MELLKDGDQVTEIYFPDDGYRWHFKKGVNGVLSITVKINRIWDVLDGEGHDLWFEVVQKLENGETQTSLWNGKYVIGIIL